MRLESLSQDQHDLYFDVHRSIRYNERRAAFYERLHRITNALTILTAGIAIVDLSGNPIPRWLVWVVALTAMAATADLVIGFGRMADLHRSLRRRFCLLQSHMVKAFPDAVDIRQLELERLDIEQDEPVVYRALDVLCHNETLLALGYTIDVDRARFGYLPLYKRVTAQVWSWHDQVSVPKPRHPD